MRKLILCTLLFGLWLPVTWAQGVNIQQVNREVSREFNNGSLFASDDLLGVFTNSTFISGLQQLATDASQVARITQDGDNNTATLRQQGSNNVGIIDITGSGNTAGLTQTGNGLFSFIGISGAGNELDVLQEGTALQNLILIEGSGLNFDVLQNAGGVQLTQTGSSIPLQIERSAGGRTLPIIIRNN